MVYIHRKIKYIISNAVCFIQTKDWIWKYMWDRQEFGYRWERITKNNWKSEESDLRGYIVGHHVSLIHVVGKCGG